MQRSASSPGTCELFHVKHIHVGASAASGPARRRGACPSWPSSTPPAFKRRLRPVGEIHQRGKGARAHHVKALPRKALRLSTRACSPRRLGSLSVAAACWMKAAFLATVSTQVTSICGTGDGDHHAGQPAAGTDVEQLHRPSPTCWQQGPDGRQAVEQVVGQHLGRVAHGRQVVDLVPLLEQSQVVEQQVDLTRVKRELERLQAGLQRGPQDRSCRHRRSRPPPAGWRSP